jgi:VanZ family protein
VLNKRTFLKYWLPVVLWMALIFTGSSDIASSQRSSRIIGPILHWLFPTMSKETVDIIVLCVRKCAHLTEYAILALLVWRALRKPQKNDPRPWSWRTGRNAVLFVLFYAATDEFHQLFVATRQASVTDVLIDAIGAAIGMLLLWTLGRWRKKW